MPRSAKAVVLLDMVAVFYKKSREITYRKVVVSIDNQKVYQMVKEMKIANYYMQDGLAKVIKIK